MPSLEKDGAMSANANLIVPTFEVLTSPDEYASKKAGRPIFTDMEVIKIRFAADKQKVAVFPAHDIDPEATREQGQPVTYAMRYNSQYLAFKNQTTQTLGGTPVEELPFLTQSRRMELKALNVHTAEALAALDGTPLKQIGPGGRDLKNQAQAYLDNAAGSADVTSMAATIESLKQQLRDRDALLQVQHVPAGPAPLVVDAEEDVDGEDSDEQEQETDDGKSLDDCSDAELKEYIKRETGQAVKGNPNRATLIERAMEIATKPDA